MLSDLECTKIKGEKEMKKTDSWYFYISPHPSMLNA